MSKFLTLKIRPHGRIGSKKICTPVSSLQKMNQRGSVVVDYLLITAVVAAVGVPLIMKFFGEPIRRTLLGNRQELVSYLAQDRKETVPGVWFSKVDQADIEEREEISTTDPIEVTVIDGREQIEPGEIEDPVKIKNRKKIKVAKIKDPAKIKVPGRFGSGGGGSGGARGRSGGGFAGSSGGGSESFFAAKSNSSKSGQAGAAERGGGGYGTALKGESESQGGSGRGSGSSRKGNEKNDEEKETVSSDSTKKWNDGEFEDDGSGLSKPFDWWVLLKILIVLLIFFILGLIILGSAKRRG